LLLALNNSKIIDDESTSAIADIIDRLETAGYVERKRDYKDCRLTSIQSLREKAKAKMGPLFFVLQERMSKVQSNIKMRV
jgi:DNA-binding MarR family transcriptional regulator